MQDEVNEKVVTLCINGGKITARILKAAMQKALKEMLDHGKYMSKSITSRSKQAQEKKSQSVYHGKMTMKKLAAQNMQLTNVEITNDNIKSFDRCARKYDIDYSLKKDSSVDPPRYLVFFKARDVDVMTAAFKEYSAKSLKKQKRPSVRKKLEVAKSRITKHRERTKDKSKERGEVL